MWLINLQIAKNVYIDKLDDIVNKCNYTYHSTIKMKPADVNSSTYIDFNKTNNKENPNLKLVIKKLFLKGLHFKLVWRGIVITKFKSTVSRTYVISNIKGRLSGQMT